MPSTGMPGMPLRKCGGSEVAPACHADPGCTRQPASRIHHRCLQPQGPSQSCAMQTPISASAEPRSPGGPCRSLRPSPPSPQVHGMPVLPAPALHAHTGLLTLCLGSQYRRHPPACCLTGCHLKVGPPVPYTGSLAGRKHCKPQRREWSAPAVLIPPDSHPTGLLQLCLAATLERCSALDLQDY